MSDVEEPAADEGTVAEERRRRLEKLDRLAERGGSRYPPRFDRDHMVAAVRERFDGIAADARTGERVRVAGRLMLIRRHGGVIFAMLRDSSGELQLEVSREVVGEAAHDDFEHLDLGDWVGVEGEVIGSHSGELSVELGEWELLTKALRTLPKEEHGPRDVDVRYRERYLDLIVNPDARRIFQIRSAAIASVRQTLIQRGFAEVETPVLDTAAGGAAARPFITHHNALDIDMYLRIALELPLKRLVVGGMERVFEIGRVFRNEGLDTRHNPEFTLLEAYQALGDYHDMMDLVETIVSRAATDAIGTTKIEIDGKPVDLAPPWRRVSMADLVREQTGAEMHPSMPIEEARSIASDMGLETEESWGAGRILAEVYDEHCEAELIEPTFVLDHPREVSPLARAHRDDPTLTERFEAVVGARELANAYSELNDPVDQRERFEAEARAKAAGDEEAEDVDEDYIRALEFGLPPTGGLGIGIDRLVMLIAGADTIREVILFPTMRPEGAAAGPHAGAGAPGLPSPEVMAAPESEPEVDGPAVGTEPAPASDPPRPGPGPSARALGWLTAVVGILSLVPTLPVVSGPLGIEPLLGRDGRIVSDIASVLVGFALIAVAYEVGRGRRAAFRVAVGLFAVSALAHAIRGPDPIVVVLDLAMLAGLVANRGRFRVPPNPRSALALLRFIPAYLALVGAFSVLTLFVERDKLSPSFSVAGALEAGYVGLVGVQGPFEYSSAAFEDFFEWSLIVLAVAGLLTALFLLFRPLTQRGGPSADDRAKARALVRRWGSDSLAYFALHPRKSYFFSSDGRAMVAYAYAGGYALVSADPIGAPGSIRRVLDEFLAYCADRGWRVSFLAVREELLGLYTERGLRGVYLGDEAMIDCRRFGLGGGAMKPVREAAHRVGREHRFRLIRESEAGPALVARLNEISRQWRGDTEERGFTMELTREVEGVEEDFLLALCLDAEERPVGFLRLVPCYGADPGFSLDLMRRLPDAPNGLTEFLIANTALALGERGFRRLSMNFAAWGRLFEEGRALGPIECAEKAMATALNPFFQIESLRDFNQKFQPEWLPRSIVIEDAAQMARVGLLYATIEGQLELPVLGRLLVPPQPATGVGG
ncbi:MAG TPA: lysine--tRNA ligase [Solirubrobacterales bacterium]|nr:lysine--tRNA ligase [Solirubrobacterales bacterium]